MIPDDNETIDPELMADVPDGTRYYEIEGRRAEDVIDDLNPWQTKDREI